MEGMMPEVSQQVSVVDPSLEARLRAFTDAFNRFNVNEVSSFWAEDGTLISPLGAYGKGRSGVARVYGTDASTILNGTKSTFTILGVRNVGGDCVFGDLDHEIQDFEMPDGSTDTVKLHLVILARKKGDSWLWLDARPYAFMRPPERTH